MAPTTTQTSRLLRFSIVVLIALAILATIGLVTEGIAVLGNATRPNASVSFLRLILLGTANLLLTTL